MRPSGRPSRRRSRLAKSLSHVCWTPVAREPDDHKCHPTKRYRRFGVLAKARGGCTRATLDCGGHAVAAGALAAVGKSNSIQMMSHARMTADCNTPNKTQKEMGEKSTPRPEGPCTRQLGFVSTRPKIEFACRQRRRECP